jgi:hypothetical protein
MNKIWKYEAMVMNRNLGVVLSRFFVLSMFSPLFVLIMLLITPVNIVPDLNINIGILSYSNGYCGGEFNNSGMITHWTGRSVLSFSLGVANFDTKPHTLKQVNVTTTGNHAANYSDFKVITSIGEEGHLPVTLQSQRYWQYNFSCLRCTMSISVQLKVDDQVLDFGIIAQGAAGFHSSLLTSWTNVHYYTESVTSPLSSSVVLIAITILVIFHRLRKRKNQELIDFTKHK